MSKIMAYNSKQSHTESTDPTAGFPGSWVSETTEYITIPYLQNHASIYPIETDRTCTKHLRQALARSIYDDQEGHRKYFYGW